MISPKHKSLMHVAKTKLGLSDDEYREILYSCSDGKYTSSAAKGFTLQHFQAVMKAFEKLGFVQKVKVQQPDREGFANSDQINKIRIMWQFASYADDKEAALSAFLKKRFHISDLRFLKYDRAKDVIEAIKDMYLRDILTSVIPNQTGNNLLNEFNKMHASFTRAELAFLMIVAISQGDKVRDNIRDAAVIMRDKELTKLVEG